MKDINITENIKYIGVDDKDLDLFENQYILKNGISYNSYLIQDEKNTIMDTVDKRKTNEWLNNLEKELDGKKPDYLVISHLEPDHSGSIGSILKKYPEIKIISNEKVFSMLPQFIDLDEIYKKQEIENANFVVEKSEDKSMLESKIQNWLDEKKIVVKEGDTINLGKHILQFIMAPMVHWPEVMMTYEQTEKILFSADAFGKFGTLDTDEPWVDESRRYFINIVGKYGMQVQNVLKKASSLDIRMICALHGPILKENLGYYINLYDTWSKYEPEEEGILVVCGSLHGNTYEAAKKLANDLEEKGNTVKLVDISRTPIPDVVSDAFKYSKLCIACVTYNMNIFPAMNSFLHLLREKNYQNRKIGIIENGSWAPNAAKVIKDMLSTMKNIEIVEPVVTIKTRLSKESEEKMKKLEDAISK